MTFTNKNSIVMFDLSGVFFNEGLKVAVKKISERFGLEPAKIEYVLNGDFAKEYRTGLVEPDEFWKKAKSELKIQKTAELALIFFSSYHPNLKTVDLLSKLRKAGIKTGYLSNSPKDRTKYLDAKYMFLAMFDFGLCSYEAHAWKPDVEFFEIFLKKFKIRAQNVIYIEDKEQHLKPALDLGMATVLYKSTDRLEVKLRNMGLKF